MSEAPTLPPSRAERRAARKAAKAARPKRRLSTKSVIGFVLLIQIAIALFLMGRDLAVAIPQIAFPSTQPRFDTPVIPGDQTRRFAPGNTPLAPARDGNPDRPFRSTGDMPRRLSFERRGETLTLTGQIAEGDAERWRNTLDTETGTITHIRLNSPGGSVNDALDIGREIRAAGFATLLGAGDICLSACPYILAAGETRQVHDSAQVGVHQHYFGKNSALPAFLAVEDIQTGQARVMGYLTDMGIDLRVMQHALSTPPDEIYVLLQTQLEEYKLITEEAP